VFVNYTFPHFGILPEYREKYMPGYTPPYNNESQKE